jgi:hypothetical protein
MQADDGVIFDDYRSRIHDLEVELRSLLVRKHRIASESKVKMVKKW